MIRAVRRPVRLSLWYCPHVFGYASSVLIALQIADRAEAHIDFDVSRAIEPCLPEIPGTNCFTVSPLLQPEQFLLPVDPIPEPYPPLTNLAPGTPPFIEIFDVPGLDLVGVEPPPPFEARVRMFGDPGAQLDIVDSPNAPNLLLIYAGANQIMGPEDFDPFHLQLPPGVAQLQFFAYAFDGQGNPVANVGTIQVPEPGSFVLVVSGTATCSWLMGRRRRIRKVRR